MAQTIVRLVPKVRVEAATAFSGTGTAYVFPLDAEDHAYAPWFIWADQAPGSDFDDAPAGSVFIRTTAGSVTMYIATVAGTWTVVGTQS